MQDRSATHSYIQLTYSKKDVDAVHNSYQGHSWGWLGWIGSGFGSSILGTALVFAFATTPIGIGIGMAVTIISSGVLLFMGTNEPHKQKAYDYPEKFLSPAPQNKNGDYSDESVTLYIQKNLLSKQRSVIKDGPSLVDGVELKLSTVPQGRLMKGKITKTFQGEEAVRTFITQHEKEYGFFQSLFKSCQSFWHDLTTHSQDKAIDQTSIYDKNNGHHFHTMNKL